MQYLYGGYEHTGDGTAGTMAQYSIPTVVIDRPGYIYVYCSFENTTTSDYAFFDDLSVRTSRSVVQADDYYPFGLTFNSYSSGSDNNYLYNQGAEDISMNAERQEELGLDITFYRMYDYALGRFIQVDPKADQANQEGWSPYQYAFNNPILYNDPLGDTVKILYKEVMMDQYHVAIIDQDNETGEETVIVEGFPEVGSNPASSGDEETGESGWGDLIREERTNPASISEENKEVVETPEGMTEGEFKQQILDNADTYQNDVDYFPVPGLLNGTGNSNSLVGSVLRASGSDFKTSKSTPGFKVNVLPSQKRKSRTRKKE